MRFLFVKFDLSYVNEYWHIFILNYYCMMFVLCTATKIIVWRNALFLDSKNITHLMMYIPLFFIFYYFYRILEAILSTAARLKWRIYVFHPVEGRLTVLLWRFYLFFFIFFFLSIHFFGYFIICIYLYIC